VYVRNHDTRTFVERADFRSSFGYGDGPADRASLGFTGGGPALVVSPISVLHFDDERRLRLASVHPGHSVEEVQERTGFDLGVGNETVPTTEPPSELELVTLRERVDVTGVLRRL
jgi:glutaconate CoA-transferase subunit B